MPRRLNRLELVHARHPHNPEAVYYELSIDGRLLREHLEKATREQLDVICPLGWTRDAHAQAYAARLLLLEPPVLPDGRRELLVCPLCADLACGCIAAEIEREGETYVWRRLGYTVDYDSEIEEPYRLGAFVFDAGQYRAALAPHAGPLTPPYS